MSRQSSREPEPPKVVRVKSRTSRPRLTVTCRSALAWFHAEISSTPAAQASADMPSSFASVSMPALAAPASSGISPPSRWGGMRPRKTWASVMVTSVPPLP